MKNIEIHFESKSSKSNKKQKKTVAVIKDLSCETFTTFWFVHLNFVWWQVSWERHKSNALIVKYDLRIWAHAFIKFILPWVWSKITNDELQTNN